MKKVYIIWIWWIWISAIARYYLHKWYSVFWSDKVNSELIENLKSEWVNIIIWEDEKRIEKDFEKIIFTEAVPENQKELKKAKKLNIKTQSYPEALANIVNSKKLIAISWTHWKSTTTSLTSLILKNSEEDFWSIVWTILKEFNWKNFYYKWEEKPWDYFVIEACEYKRSFLKYTPTVTVITNIEIDHLDYYKDEDDYINAFKELIDNTIKWWFVILNAKEKNSAKLINERKDLNYITIHDDYFKLNKNEFPFPKISLKIPWEHILYDAKIAYIIGHMIWIENKNILSTLSSYNWVWRRNETIWKTENWNILMSDYWHHPTEIELTIKAIKKANKDKKILTIFQPHQYSRTLELLDEFKNCFKHTDKLIIPDIYESRDSLEDKEKINSKKLISLINHKDKLDWEWLKNTEKLISKYDKKNPNSSIIILLWAWNVDDLRYKIKTS